MSNDIKYIVVLNKLYVDEHGINKFPNSTSDPVYNSGDASLSAREINLAELQFWTNDGSLSNIAEDDVTTVDTSSSSVYSTHPSHNFVPTKLTDDNITNFAATFGREEWVKVTLANAVNYNDVVALVIYNREAGGSEQQIYNRFRECKIVLYNSSKTVIDDLDISVDGSSNAYRYYKWKFPNYSSISNNESNSPSTTAVIGDNYSGGESWNDEVSSTTLNAIGICILEGSYIMTDQGNKKIENLNPNNTIHGLPIIDVYQSKACFPFTLFKKGCFGHKIPNRDTYISNKHLVFNRKTNKLDNAEEFINNKTIVKSNHDYNKYCYHIFLKNWSLVKVNNLECETLCNIHPICINYYLEKKLYQQSFIELMKNQANLIVTLNDIYIKNNRILFKNRIKNE